VVQRHYAGCWPSPPAPAGSSPSQSAGGSPPGGHFPG
jgi:hypothetical protein